MWIGIKIKTCTKGVSMKGKRLSYSERLAKLENDAIERKKLFKELQDHVAQGLSVDCFPPLSIVSIKEFFKRYPNEFNEMEYENALRQGKAWWENIGRKQSSGDCLGNSRTWFYNMSNRYAWSEKAQLETKNEHSVSVNVVSYSHKKPSTTKLEQ